MNQDTPLYNQFGIYVGSVSSQSLLSSIGNNASDPIAPSSISTGQFNTQIGLVSGYLKSSNFIAGSAGWQISANGDVEFNNGTFRGTITGSTIIGGTIETATSGARVVIDTGNTISLYDATTSSGGVVSGSAATIKYIQDADTSKYFATRRRASIYSSNDGVLETYSTTPSTNNYNYMYFGRSGDQLIVNTNVVSLDANIKSGESASSKNGQIQLSVCTNGSVPANPHIAITDSRTINASYSGVSILAQGSGSNMYVGIGEAGILHFYFLKGFGATTGIYSDINVNPETNITQSLGTSDTRRWLKTWTKHVDVSGDIYLNSVGQVNSDGTAGTPFPSGWTCNRQGPGYYRIAHNLSTQNCVVTANAYTTAARACQVYVISADYFEIQTTNTAGTAVDTNIGFIFIRNVNG